MAAEQTQVNRQLERAMQKVVNLEQLCSRAEKNNDVEDGDETTKLSCLGAKYGMRLRAIEQEFHDAYNEELQSGEHANRDKFEDARERIATLKTMIKQATNSAKGRKRVQNGSGQ